MARYQAQVGGMFGSGINQKPQTGVSIDVAPLAGVIAQALAAKRDGLIHKAMLSREFERQDAMDQQAKADREAQAAAQAEERTYTRSRQDRLDSLAEAKQAEETAAKRAELGIVPDHYAPVMDPVSPVSDFRVPTIRSAMQASVGQFGGGAPKTGLALPPVPSVGAIPKMQLVAGVTDPTLGTKYQEEQAKFQREQDTKIPARVRQLVAGGMPLVEANKQARLEFGEAPQQDKTDPSQNPMLMQRQIQNASNLRQQFNGDKSFQDAQSVATSLASARSAMTQGTAAGDMSAIFTFMKALDPGSTVREGEYASAKNATGVPGRILNMYNKTISGQILTPEQRKDFLGTIETLAKARRNSFKGTIQRYSNVAKSLQLDPADVVYDPFSVLEDKPDLPPLADEDKAHAARDPKYKAWLVSKGYTL